MKKEEKNLIEEYHNNYMNQFIYPKVTEHEVSKEYLIKNTLKRKRLKNLKIGQVK